MRPRPVQAVIRDALNMLEEHEYIWYITKDKLGKASLICDLTGAHFNTLPNDQREHCSVSAQTYQRQYKQPCEDKISTITEAFTTKIAPLGPMTGLDRCQITILSKIFTFNEEERYKPKFGIIKVNPNSKQLYLEFPLKDCRKETKEQKRYSTLLTYLSAKLKKSHIKLKTPSLISLATYITKEPEQSTLEAELESFAQKIVLGYQRDCVSADIAIKANDKQLLELAKAIVEKDSMDQWTTAFSQKAKALNPEHSDLTTLSDLAQLDSKKSSRGVTFFTGSISPIGSTRSAFKPITRSRKTNESSLKDSSPPTSDSVSPMNQV